MFYASDFFYCALYALGSLKLGDSIQGKETLIERQNAHPSRLQ